MSRKKLKSDIDLLAAARTVFVSEGFAASTKSIAKLAGVSEALLFQRFVKKEDLFFAAMVPPAVELTTLFQHPNLSGLPLVEQVVLSMVGYFRQTMPVLIPLLSHPGFQFEEFAARYPDSSMMALRKELTGFVIRQQAAGWMAKVDPGPAALQLWSIAQTVAFLEHMGARDGNFPDSFLRTAVHCLWQGLKR